MKALILNFAAFSGRKDPDKSYYRFDMWDIEGKAFYQIFTEQQYMAVPDGVVPNQKECRETFPRLADVDFQIQQYQTREGKTAFSPRVNSINKWKSVDLSKL